MSDLQIVVCAPLAAVGELKFDPATAPYSVYSKVRCPHCAQVMWLGERSRVMVESGRAQMICMVCAVTHGLMGPGDTLERLTDRDA